MMTDMNSVLTRDIQKFGHPSPMVHLSIPGFSMHIGSHGRFFEQNGQLCFEGNASEAAEEFVTYLKHHCQCELSRLRLELDRALSNEREALRQLGIDRGF
ncbi:hypothetical protein HSBAA_30460 [Vreelandella sulfidaeris]|uniref:Uncharacterized protein n=1 Tax=Vreelandella sulfidaeris TaxID=115553 RepID=A0A455U6F4_9GAMM|nr:hypothetical protein HSBAA_30460 [Halomonas sulfidaeris]